ncbi:hypothetical protein SK128_010666 [Halocaridina rubra]|uniref:Uncharacterized protein n=1 Tax=Halocaridina rubra TaxID=373956 RepID=A0AAN8ZSW5_HALRR
MWVWWVWASCLFGALVNTEAAAPFWQPCKLQCDNNFSKNDLIQTALVSVCERGCDLFTVALISTPQNSPVLHLGPVLLPQNAPDRSSPHDLVVKWEKTKAEKEPDSGHDIRRTRFYNRVFGFMHAITDESKSNSDKLPQSKPRQTTTQPADHPVQDHPAQAANQATTLRTPVTTSEAAKPKPEKKIVENGEENNGISSSSDKHEEAKTIDSQTLIIREEKDDDNLDKESMIDKKKGKQIKKATVVIRQEILKQHNDKKEDSSAEEIQKKQSSHQEITIVTGNERLEQAKHTCRHACFTAYFVPAEQDACAVGCHLQATTASLQSDHMVNPKPAPNTPLAVFQHVMFSLAGHVGRLVRVTWGWTTGASQQDSTQEKIQVYGSESQTGNSPNDYSKLLKQFIDTVPKSATISRAKGGVTLMTLVTHHDSEHAGQHAQQQQPSQQQTQQQQQQNQQSQLQQNLQQQQLDLLECISRKSGLPRWFIAVTIFTSALVILWLCFTLTAPPDDIKVVKTKPPELDLEEEEEELEEEDFSCSEKKKLLAQADDVIKIRIENV